MKVVCTIEARMNSTRLPGKVLMKSCGETMLGHLTKRLKRVKSLDCIVLATTFNKSDNILEEFANEFNIECFRGSEDNVLNRVLNAAETHNADVIVEITADCPLIDPDLIEKAINIFKNYNVDYVSNCNIRSYPDGMDVQVFSKNALKKSAFMTTSDLEKEHVTLHIRNNPNMFKIFDMVAPESHFWPNLGLTLDEINDYKLLDIIISNFNKRKEDFNCLDIINFLKDNPDLIKINQNVSRRGDN